MPLRTVSEFILGDIVARYLVSADDLGSPELQLLPLSKRLETKNPREMLATPSVLGLPQKWQPIQAWASSPLVQLRIAGDPALGGFSNGRTSHGESATGKLRWDSQEEISDSGKICIRTALKAAHDLTVLHELTYREGERALSLQTTLCNEGSHPLSLDALSSFVLGGISPYSNDDATGRLLIHRIRSAWSGEGRSCSESVESLHLERTWTGYSVQCERFGAVGSMPVNGWHPWLAVEDQTEGVIWAAALSHPGSWQMEIVRRADQLAISGGHADYEFGHWRKELQPQETFRSPTAFLTVTSEDIESAAERLADPIRRHPSNASEPADDLPIVFNEWCTSWGNPNHDNIVALAKQLSGTGVTYLVIDDGWAKRSPGALFQENGDWEVCPQAFPGGLRPTADAVRERGLIPGLWFEFEVVNAGTQAWDEVDHLLKRDGQPLQVGTRRFWDFRDPWVHEHLATKVIKLLRDSGIGYLKIDYNDTIGLGCDGAESLGEGLRQHLEGVQRFLRTLRETLPDLVIENCSSGGHRLEPSMLMLTDLTSITDAHETPDIPIIAANVLQVSPPSKNLIWAVLRDSDSLQRLSYSLSATFLGRMCLSGNIAGLNQKQWAFTTRAIALYNRLAPVIRKASFRRFGDWGESYQHPTGGQAVRAISADKTVILVVWHTFDAPPNELWVTLPVESPWELSEELSDLPHAAKVDGNLLIVERPPAWSGGIATLFPIE